MGITLKIICILAFLSCYPLFYWLDNTQHGISWGAAGLTLNAQAHAGTLGSFAGFIAAIVVIFLSKRENGESREKTRCKHAAIATFLSAFLIAILGSFQYASFTGFTEYWQSLCPSEAWKTSIGGVFPGYVFNLIGFDYLLAVYLGFYGLVLAVDYCTRPHNLSGLTYFMLAMVFVLGSVWVFLDFRLSEPLDQSAVDFSRVGVVYVTPVVIAALFGGRLSRFCRDKINTILYINLVVCLAFVAALGVLFAHMCSISPDLVTVKFIRHMMTTTVHCTAAVAGLMFGVFIFCLSGFMDQLTVKAN